MVRGLEFVYSHDYLFHVLNPALVFISAPGNFILDKAFFNCINASAHGIDFFYKPGGIYFHFVCKFFNKPGTTERIGGICYAAFICNDLLGTQGNACSFFGWEAKSFIITICME